MRLEPSFTVPHALAACLIALAVAQPASGQGWLTPPPAPPENPVTAEKAVLGKILFWDEQLSSDGSIACGTCHIPGVGGSDPRTGPDTIFPGADGVYGTADDGVGSPGVVRTNAFGHYSPSAVFGLDVQVTRRQSPSTIMAAYFDELFWDGRAQGTFIDPFSGTDLIQSGGALESQSLAPLVSDVEMADGGRGFGAVTERLKKVRPLALATNLPPDVTAAIALDPTYPALFRTAFGTTDITAGRIAFALATYQRTLVADQTPFDDFARGNQTALDPQQRRGQFAFETTAICGVCHTPPLFLSQAYHSLALRPSAEDPGRFEVTGDPADLGKFKSVSLRNVALRKHWFHHGAPGVTTLRDAVAVYATGGGAFDNRDPVLNGFTLTASEVDDLTAFLQALTDPRVAAEAPPFDRPMLRSERGTPNPLPLGVGAVAGQGGFTPRAIVAAAPFLGAERFRLGLAGARGGALAAVRLTLVNAGGFATGGGALAVRGLPLPTGPLAVLGGEFGAGYATWQMDLSTTPALLGLTLDAQWWVRDNAAAGGVAKSDAVRFTVE